MEIKEIVSFYLNNDTNILEVTFRTIEDSDEHLRTDNIEIDIIEEYGYSLKTESFDFFDDESDEEFDSDEEMEIDEYELTSFLNEYYTINPNKLPISEVY